LADTLQQGSQPSGYSSGIARRGTEAPFCLNPLPVEIAPLCHPSPLFDVALLVAALVAGSATRRRIREGRATPGGVAQLCTSRRTRRVP